MKIMDSSAAYRLYQKTGTAPSPVGEQQNTGVKTAPMPISVQKTDQVSLSGQVARNEGVGKIAQSISSELSIGVLPARMQSLKAAVENGEYYVPTAHLADTILNMRG